MATPYDGLKMAILTIRIVSFSIGQPQTRKKTSNHVGRGGKGKGLAAGKHLAGRSCGSQIAKRNRVQAIGLGSRRGAPGR